jgi:prepilin-type N-terminal cleavage/methylation domain-containing protein
MSRIESRVPRVVQLGEASGSRRSGFTLIEVMVVVLLLSLIVIALMAVFNSTQAAFRASVTQTDVLEGGRAVIDLMAGDLKEMAPSLGGSNSIARVNNGFATVNFYANTNAGYVPLIQTLTASPNNQQRTYVLQQFFVLNHQNTKWWGVGYMVLTNSPDGIYSLYRIQYPSDKSAVNPVTIFTNQAVQNFFINPTNGGSHLIDGVVGLRVRAFDNNGYWMTNTLNFAGGPTPASTNKNVLFLLPSALGETGFYMFSNTLPASVEIEMDTLEDRTLQRAGSIPILAVQSNYLAQQSGKVHVFRQRVSIPNAGPATYQ